MKRSSILSVLELALVACAVVLLGGGVVRATRASAAQGGVHDLPGAEHQKLMQRAGTYTTSTRFDMGGGMKPMQSTGEATFRAALDGRFLIQEEKNAVGGEPFEALKLYGYNVAAKRYEGVWTYTHSTAIMTLAGSSEDGGKTIVYEATYAGDHETPKFRITMKEIDADHFVITLVGLKPDGSKDATMETTYARKK